MNKLLPLLICLIIAALYSMPARATETVKENPRTTRRVFRLSLQMQVIAKPCVPLLTEVPPDADVVGNDSLAIEPAQHYQWLASPGEDFQFQVRGISSDGTESSVLTIWDWENRPVAQTRFSMPFAGKVACKVEGRGTYIITLDGMRGNECLMRLARSFSVCPPNEKRRNLWKKSGFWVGQCSFPGWHDREVRGHTVYPSGLTPDESIDLEAKLIARMGVQVARINLSVGRRDNEGLDLDFSLADKCLKAYVSRGLDMDIQLFGPHGAGLGPILDKYLDIDKLNVIYPLKEKPYRHFIRESARRYGKYAKFFQIGNEPGNPHQYGGTAEEYIDQVKQAVDEIRRAKPNIPITNGGYCLDNDPTKKIISETRGLTDFISYHWHGYLTGLKDFWGSIDRIHQDAGYTNPEYCNTEMGFAMPTVGGERTNAVVEMQKLLYCWAHGQKGVLLYSSRELWWPRQYSYNGISDYGFVDYFFCPRFVYGAASAFLDRYAGFKFERILKESDNLNVYEFKSGKQKMIAVFAVTSPVSVKLKSSAHAAKLIDPMGNELPLDDPKLILIQAGEYPQAVLLDNAENTELYD